MKLKPIYMYGIMFVIIIAAIIFSSTSGNEEMTKVSNPNGEMDMPQDAVHQGMNSAGDDSPSKSNVREDFWTKMEEYKMAIEANPNDTLAMKNYAQMLGMSHQTENAIELYDKILAIDPSRVDILLAVGLVFYNDQNFVMAEVTTKKIIALDENNLEAKYNLGVIAASQGKDEEAKKIWKELADNYPNDKVGKLATNSLAKINE